MCQLGKHCADVAAYHFRQLHLAECQLDELWTFVRKKEEHLTPIEQMMGEYGDAWIWIAFAPVSKIVPAWVAGKRSLAMGRQLVKCLKNRLDEHIRFSPVMTCRTMPMRCWRCMGRRLSHPAPESPVVRASPTRFRRRTCCMPSYASIERVLVFSCC